MPRQSDYTTQALVDRITLKARTSNATSLTPQEIVDLANDSLRSYVVPLTQMLREEWWVGKYDIVLVTDSDGAVKVPDSVASTLRTVAWNNAGVITPLTRIEPEASFAYLNTAGSMPVGFELRGYTLVVLPKVPGVSLHLTAMLRPPQMVLSDEAGLIESHSSLDLTLAEVPLAWQEASWLASDPTVDLVSSVSPFSVVVADCQVSDLVGNVLSLHGVDPTLIEDGFWVSDPGTSPFANVPIELYPLLEQDVVCTLFQSLGDKRLDASAKRKIELEGLAKRTMGPRTAGNARPIVNPSAPGMNGFGGVGGWGRR